MFQFQPPVRRDIFFLISRNIEFPYFIKVVDDLFSNIQNKKKLREKILRIRLNLLFKVPVAAQKKKFDCHLIFTIENPKNARYLKTYEFRFRFLAYVIFFLIYNDDGIFESAELYNGIKMNRRLKIEKLAIESNRLYDSLMI